MKGLLRKVDPDVLRHHLQPRRRHQPGGAPASYTYGVGATLPTPTRSGYTFAGWYTNAGFTGSPVTAISATDTGDKAFFAKWTAVPVHLSDHRHGRGGRLDLAGRRDDRGSGATRPTRSPLRPATRSPTCSWTASRSGAVTTYTFTNVTANHTISATFAAVSRAPRHRVTKTRVSLGTPVAPKTMKTSQVLHRLRVAQAQAHRRHQAGVGLQVQEGRRQVEVLRLREGDRLQLRQLHPLQGQDEAPEQGQLAASGLAPADAKHLKTWSAKYDYVTVK